MVGFIEQFQVWFRPNIRISGGHLLAIGSAAVSVAVVVGVLAVIVISQSPLSLWVADRQSVGVAGPVTVELGQEVAAGFETTIEPNVPGEWSTKRGLLGTSAVSLRPVGRFETGRTYTIHLRKMRRALTGRAIGDIDEKFTTQVPAKIDSVRPANGVRDVLVGTQITVVLNEPNRGLRDLKGNLSPAAKLRLVKNDDRTLIWQPEKPLAQGTAYTFSLRDMNLRDGAKQLLASVTFTTVTQPAIVSARTGGLFSPGQTVDVVFDQGMDEGATRFEFNMSGTGSWIDDHTYRYIPKDLQAAKTYHYVVRAGAKSKLGGFLEQDHDFDVATNGAVGATVSPGGDVAVTTPIRINFDQAVDHASAQARFSISPSVAGSFSWSGNSMIFNHADFASQTSYNYSVAAGVMPVWGLPSAKAWGGSFSTAPPVVKLNVPLYKQTFGNGCELTSLRMVLAFRGIAATEWDIVQRIGYNPRNRDTATNTWDDPNLTFVGFLNGYQNSSGYGVHAGPIASAAQSFGRGATAYHGVSANFIAAQIHAGNPVIFWGHSTPAKADSWNTPTSGVIQSWLSAHARVAYEVVGRADAPIGFYVNDPWTGKTFYWTAAQLIDNMNVIPGVSNQAVVVN